MQASVEQFLEQVARKGSWVGGGSVAALCSALAAAMLEKLVSKPSVARELRRVRRQCLHLIVKDAQCFARVISSTRAKDHKAFARSLKAATDVPAEVFEHSQLIQTACKAAQDSIKPKFRSDLHCAMSVALAAGESACSLINTNLAWLKDEAYATQIHKRLLCATRVKTV